jgi:hypothetical protein
VGDHGCGIWRDLWDGGVPQKRAEFSQRKPKIESGSEEPGVRSEFEMGFAGISWDLLRLGGGRRFDGKAPED